MHLNRITVFNTIGLNRKDNPTDHCISHRNVYRYGRDECERWKSKQCGGSKHRQYSIIVQMHFSQSFWSDTETATVHDSRRKHSLSPGNWLTGILDSKQLKHLVYPSSSYSTLPHHLSSSTWLLPIHMTNGVLQGVADECSPYVKRDSASKIH